MTPQSEIAPQCSPVHKVQSPDQEFHGGFVFLHADADYGSRASDDFIVIMDDQQTTPPPSIGAIRWWGTYESTFDQTVCSTIPVEDDFVIQIAHDDQGEPGQPMITFEAGHVDRKATGHRISFVDDHPEFVYSFSLPVPFSMQYGERYWLIILNSIQDDCVWSWATAPEGCEGNRRSYWDEHGKGFRFLPLSMAFSIHGPTTDCLLAGSNPPDGATDVRLGDVPGWSAIDVAWGGPSGGLQPADFEVSSTAVESAAINQISVTEDGVRLFLTHPLPADSTLHVIVRQSGE
ncbi:MAG: hypothetical protein ACPGXK_05450, partial [Phycisphaerae bacterium]